MTKPLIPQFELSANHSCTSKPRHTERGKTRVKESFQFSAFEDIINKANSI